MAQDAIATYFDADPPQFLYLPWSYHERDPLRELLETMWDDALWQLKLRAELLAGRRGPTRQRPARQRPPRRKPAATTPRSSS